MRPGARDPALGSMMSVVAPFRSNPELLVLHAVRLLGFADEARRTGGEN